MTVTSFAHAIQHGPVSDLFEVLATAPSSSFGEMLQQTLGGQTLERLCWALLHFLWQGGAITAVLAIARFLLRHQPPAARYRAACCALLARVAGRLSRTSSWRRQRNQYPQRRPGSIDRRRAGRDLPRSRRRRQPFRRTCPGE